jgi:5'-nucleotidase
MPARPPFRRSSLLVGLAVAATGLVAIPVTATANPAGTGLVISEVYGGGGNSGATFKNDFIELFNPTGAAITVDGWSVQWRSAGGTGAGAVTPLKGSVPAGGHYLVQEAVGTGGTVDLPAADATGTIAMGGSNGQGWLATTTTALTPPVGNVVDAQGNLPAGIVDFVGVNANSFEGATAPGMSNTTSASRGATGTDTNNNGADFTAGAADPQNSGSTTPPVDPPEEFTGTIAEIQGTNAATSPHVDDIVTTRGVVTAVYPSGGFFGYYIQTPGTGGAGLDLGTHTASDGIFVRQPSGAITVTPGQYLEVTGVVAEYAGATQITVPAADAKVLGETAAPVTAATTTQLPATAAQRESLEGMLYRPTGAYTVTNTYSTNQFGEVGLAAGDKPLIQPTEVARPGSPEAAAVAADNAARGIVLDDGASTNFTATSTKTTDCGTRPTPCLTNGNLTPPYISNDKPVRVGARTTFVSDVIFTEGGSPTAPTYRFQPLTPVVGPDNATSPATFENTRVATPDKALVAKRATPDVKVASFNVLNYFTTLGDADDDNVGDGGCQPYTDRDGDGDTVNGGCDQRGAWDPQDLARQQQKIVAAINALDADVVGLMEIENSAALGETPDEATQTLVAALNAVAGAGTWAANPSSTELPAASEQDVITNAIIYKPAMVQRVGAARALGNQSTGTQAFGNAREPIAQVFTPVAGGQPFLFVVNHFKSKGSAGPHAGDTDQGDGQGAGQVSRELQAAAVRDWVPTVLASTSTPTQAVLMAGDYNSYTEEDALHILYDAGYSDVEKFFGNGEYSYSFSGLSGSLDHVLANEAAIKLTTGTDIWNINSGEALAMEYSRWNYHATDFHTPGPFRSSDHDPVIVGLDLVPPPGTPATTVTAKVTPQRVVVDRTRAVAHVTVATGGTTAGNGTAEVREGSTLLASAPVVNGVVNVKLPAFTSVGEHTLTVRYVVGSSAVAETTVLVDVLKAASDARATAATTKSGTPVVGVRVKAQGLKAKGKVKLVVKGTSAAKGKAVLKRTVRLKGGKATVRLAGLRPGRYTVVVRYLGNDETKGSKETLRLRVRR